MNKPEIIAICSCGWREEDLRTTHSAKYWAGQHQSICRGVTIVSPVPAYEIAEAYTKVHGSA